MGYSLSRMDDGLEWTCNQSLWSFVLESAKEKGWQPMGTFKIDDDSGDEDPAWDGRDYHSNDGQGVQGEDSENLAKALEKYLEEESPEEIERKIILSFLEWVSLEGDFPGFEIY